MAQGVPRRETFSITEPEAGRVTRHRSSRACQSCRARKVRCDALANGACCTNCRLDNLECVLQASRRGKNKRTSNKSGTREQAPTGAQVQIQSPLSPATPESSGSLTGPTRGYSSIAPVQTEDGDIPVCLTFDPDPDERRTISGHSPPDIAPGSKIHVDPVVHEPFAYSDPEESSGAQPIERDSEGSLLPAFIAPLSGRMSRNDVGFLVRKGAFTTPPPDLRMEILRSYTRSVHPFMPILDLEAFASAVQGKGADRRVSVLLFQAVMFAGLCSLEMSVVRRLGYESTKSAREAFFGRVRLLYDFDVETESMPIIQSLLLMSSWYSRWNERKHTWHWTGIALSTAQSMGLHREPTSRHGDEKTRRLRRRLWWTLYIRDRTIALGTRRPMRIRDSDYDVAMLELQDFDIEPSGQSFQGQSVLNCTADSTYLALMCIELARLSVCAGRVLSSQYTTLSTEHDASHSLMVAPRPDGQGGEDIKDCDNEINQWLLDLPTNTRGLGSLVRRGQVSECVETHWTMLNMMHLTLISVLHRTQSVRSGAITDEAQAMQRASRSKVKSAARKLTQLANTMLRRNHIRYLPLSGVTALVSAILSHILDMRSADDDVRDAGILRFYQSLEALQALSDIYASADAAISFLASVVRKANIPVSLPLNSSGHGLLSPSTDRPNEYGPGSAMPTNPGQDVISRHWQETAMHQQSNTPASDPSLDKEQHPAWLSDTYGTASGSARNTMPSSIGNHDNYMSTGYCRDAAPTTPHICEAGQSPRCLGAGFDGLSGLATDELFLTWNGSMAGDNDIDSLLFNYDFSSDAFRLLCGRTEGP